MSNWSRKRQIFYLAGFLVFWLVVGFSFYFIFKPVPSCTDGKLNQTEEGIDCGGPCARACTAAISPLRVVWIRPLLLATSTYDVAALIENSNPEAGLKQVDYIIRLYDEKGALIIDRSGQTFVNATEIFPIFESGLKTGSREAKSATIDFPTTNWLKSQPVSVPINIERVVEDQTLGQNPNPRLRLKVSNLSLQNLTNLQIYAYLMDEEQNVFAASATVLDRLAKGEVKEIFLTWPSKLSQEPTTIKTYWRLNGFQLVGR